MLSLSKLPAYTFAIVLFGNLVGCYGHRTADEDVVDSGDDHPTPPYDDDDQGIVEDDEGRVASTQIPQTTVDRKSIELNCRIKYSFSEETGVPRRETEQALVVNKLVQAADIIVPTRLLSEVQAGIDAALLQKARELATASTSGTDNKMVLQRLACHLNE